MFQKFWKINDQTESVEIFTPVLVKELEPYIGKDYEFLCEESKVMITFFEDGEETAKPVKKAQKKLAFLLDEFPDDIMYIDTEDSLEIGFKYEEVNGHYDMPQADDPEHQVTPEVYQQIIDYINGNTDIYPAIDRTKGGLLMMGDDGKLTKL